MNGSSRRSSLGVNLISVSVGAAFFFVATIIGIWAWMLFFHNWLGYDYVTVSSVLLVVGVVGGVSQTLGNAVRTNFDRSSVLFSLAMLFLLPLATSTGLAIYESVLEVDRYGSNARDLVAIYRAVMIEPIGGLGRALAGLYLPLARAMDALNSNPLLVQIVATLIASGITVSISKMAGRDSTRLAYAS